MTDGMISSSTNPAMANDLLNKALNETAPTEAPRTEVVVPSDGSVALPGGHVTFDGEVITKAEVRELTGKDEEAIARVGGGGRALNTILTRGVVKIGDEPATEKLLDTLLAGDRDALLLGVYRATWGDEATIGGWCDGCKEVKDVSVSLSSDITFKTLADPLEQRDFTVEGKKHVYEVTLPTGVTQRELRENPDRNFAENITNLLEGTVTRIDGKNVFAKSQVRDLGIADRNLIVEEISKRAPGPKFEDIVVTCPDCESEVKAPISLGSLFRI
jgi:hypothetical protein